MSSPAPRHRRSVIALHWFSVLALLAGIGLVLAHDGVESRSLAHGLVDVHRQVGVAILLAGVLRAVLGLAWRTGRVNGEGLPRSQRLLRAATHALLYLGLVATPLLGWLLTNARGQSLRFLGLPLPTLLARDRDLADSLEGWHQTLAWSLVVLAALHAAVALWHHFARRDGVLASMLPVRRPVAVSAPPLAAFDPAASGDTA
jgi:cytochrome b561